MAKKKSFSTIPKSERTLMVGVNIRGIPRDLSLDDSLNELELLAETAGLYVTGQIEQNLVKPNPKTLIGSGKVEEIKTLLTELETNVVLFDDELSPRHQRELEKEFGEEIRVLDRTALILDIFAQHAETHEGSLQVELAQYEYRLPRLTRAWTHLARQAGGAGGSKSGSVGLRGPGEKQLEVDRRDIHRRIDHLKIEIEKVREHRSRHRDRRKKSRIPLIALVGYTNSGKSTLLNRLAESDIYAADQLFATLDPTTRRVDLPGGTKALISDTVGFIQKLPTMLIAAFRATLEEITEAELLVHVVDSSHPNANEQAKSVLKTLEDIDAYKIPVLTVYNKIDKFLDSNFANPEITEIDSIAISALTGEGIEELLNLMHSKLFESYSSVKIDLPYKEGALIALFHEHGQIELIEQKREGVMIHGKIPVRYVARYQNYFIEVEGETNQD